MTIRTVHLTLAAPREPVFNFLADIENLPLWAGEFCARLELRQGRWWAYTASGEMVVDLESSAGTGVIDLSAGPAPDRLGLRPIRVLPLAAGRTLVSFTLLPSPGMSAERAEQQYRSLLADLRGLRRRFGGGEPPGLEPEPPQAKPGRN
jgi:hypothetical protein